jgi:hypothetical protein
MNIRQLPIETVPGTKPDEPEVRINRRNRRIPVKMKAIDQQQCRRLPSYVIPILDIISSYLAKLGWIPIDLKGFGSDTRCQKA